MSHAARTVRQWLEKKCPRRGLILRGLTMKLTMRDYVMNMDSRNDNRIGTADAKQKFEFQIYYGYGSTKGKAADRLSFRAFADAVARLRDGRPINPTTGTDEKETGALIGLPKIDQTKGRGKDNVRPAPWGCIDLDGITPAFAEALREHAFPRRLCAVWRTHSWSETDPRMRVLFAMSHKPDNLEDWTATVLAFYDELNRVAEEHGAGMTLKDRSCASPAQMQCSTPTGREITLYEGVPFDPVTAPKKASETRQGANMTVCGAYAAAEDTYAQTIFQDEVELLSGMTAGGTYCYGAGGSKSVNGRNAALNIAACRLFGLVAAGRLSESSVVAGLIGACEVNGLVKDDGRSSVLKTIESGRRKGMSNPSYAGLPKPRGRREYSGSTYQAPEDIPEHAYEGAWSADEPDCGQDEAAVPEDVAEASEAVRKPFTPMSELVDGINASRREEGAKIGTGLRNVDDLLNGGFKEKGLYLLGARSSLGKSALCQQIAEYIARTRPVLFYALEMDKEELVTRSFTRLARFNTSTHVNAFNPNSGCVEPRPMTASEVEDMLMKDTRPKAFEWAFGEYMTFAKNLHIRETEDFAEWLSAPSIDLITKDVIAFLNQTGARPVVIVDYLQLLRNDGDRQVTDANARLSEVSRKLKALSKHCTVLVVSSLSRAAYFDVPSLDGFKGCGDIEYSANVAMVLSCGAFSYEDDGAEKRNKAIWNEIKAHDMKVLTLDVVKGRGIKQGRCYLRYIGPSFCYEEIVGEELSAYLAQKKTSTTLIPDASKIRKGQATKSKLSEEEISRRLKKAGF